MENRFNYLLDELESQYLIEKYVGRIYCTFWWGRCHVANQKMDWRVRVVAQLLGLQLFVSDGTLWRYSTSTLFGCSMLLVAWFCVLFGFRREWGRPPTTDSECLSGKRACICWRRIASSLPFNIVIVMVMMMVRCAVTQYICDIGLVILASSAHTHKHTLLRKHEEWRNNTVTYQGAFRPKGSRDSWINTFRRRERERRWTNMYGWLSRNSIYD